MSEHKTLFDTWMELFLACLKRDTHLNGTPQHFAERARETANAAMDVVRRARGSTFGDSSFFISSRPDGWTWTAESEGYAYVCLTSDGFKLVVAKHKDGEWLAQVLRPDNGDIMLDECGYGSDTEAKAACVTAVILCSRGQLWRSGNLGKSL